VTSPVSSSVQRRSTSYAYYFVFVALGMLGGMLGPSLDVFKERSASSNARIAILFTVSAVGYMLGGAITGRLYDRRAGHPIIAAGLLGAAVVVAALTQASALVVLAVLLFLVGACASSVDTGGNTLITWLHGDDLGPWMIALHAAFGVGSALVPLVLALSRRITQGINSGLFVIVAMAVAAALVISRRPSPVHLHEERLGDGVAKPVPGRGALLVTAAFFFLYVGLEIGFAGWVFTFARDRGFSETRASFLTSMFWWSFTAGRVLGIPVAQRLSARTQILVDAGVTVGGAVLLVISAHSNVGVWFGTIVLGLGLATMFPAMLNLANERVAVTGSVTSWFIVGAGAGSATLPWVIGRLFDDRGSTILPWFVFVVTGFVVVAALSAARLLERSST
jgi:MFS transporter, FHS family, Na+ dependent glucose transporter 1